MDEENELKASFQKLSRKKILFDWTWTKSIHLSISPSKLEKLSKGAFSVIQLPWEFLQTVMSVIVT